MSSNASGYHQRGQKLYQKGDFKAAIEAFNEALNRKDVDTLGVLDNRAATYCKLKQYDQARRDARNMIKQNDQDERGYLRCAKVLLLDGKPEKALDIYAYGLKTLASNHPRRNIVDQLHKKLQDRMLLNNSKDPFTLLPFELAMLVIQNLSFKQIVAIMRVCKGWQQLLGSIPDIWLSIDLTGARCPVSFPALRSLIRRSRGLLTHATIKRLAIPQLPRSLEFLSRCPHIESLELWVTQGHREFLETFKRCKKLKNLFLSADMPIPNDWVGRFIIEFPKLERLTVLECSLETLPGLSWDLWPTQLPNLKSITLGGSRGGDELWHLPLRIPNLLSNRQPHPYQNLEELRLDWRPGGSDQVYFPDFFLRDITNLDVIEENAPPSLLHLDLRGIMPSRSLFSVLPETLQSMRFSGGCSRVFPLPNTDLKCPSLHTLIFNDTAWMTKTNLEIFLFDLQPPIRKLYLNQCFNLAWHEFFAIIDTRERNPELAKLEELGISHWRGVDDTYASGLRKLFPELKVLDLSFTDITGCTIREFADARNASSDTGAKVDRLFVRGCERVSSDAILYGKAMGLELVT